MADPAVEAAQRAWDAIIERKGGFHGTGRGPNENPWLTAIEAASEALAPLRDLHRPRHGVCDTCADPSQYGEVAPWPCDTARLIYPSEEL